MTVALYNKVHLEFYKIPCKILFELNIKILSGLGNSTLVREAERERACRCVRLMLQRFGAGSVKSSL